MDRATRSISHLRLDNREQVCSKVLAFSSLSFFFRALASVSCTATKEAKRDWDREAHSSGRSCSTDPFSPSPGPKRPVRREVQAAVARRDGIVELFHFVLRPGHVVSEDRQARQTPCDLSPDRTRLLCSTALPGKPDKQSQGHESVVHGRRIVDETSTHSGWTTVDVLRIVLLSNFASAFG